MKKEAIIPSIKETFFKPSDDRTYPNYMALAQCICGKEIDGDIKYPISADKIMTAWGIKGGEVDKDKGE